MNWLVYGKLHGRWVVDSGPCSESTARDRVVELKAIQDHEQKSKTVKAVLFEAHCVPV